MQPRRSTQALVPQNHRDLRSEPLQRIWVRPLLNAGSRVASGNDIAYGARLNGAMLTTKPVIQHLPHYFLGGVGCQCEGSLQLVATDSPSTSRVWHLRPTHLLPSGTVRPRAVHGSTPHAALGAPHARKESWWCLGLQQSLVDTLVSFKTCLPGGATAVGGHGQGPGFGEEGGDERAVGISVVRMGRVVSFS